MSTPIFQIFSTSEFFVNQDKALKSFGPQTYTYIDSASMSNVEKIRKN